MFFWYIYRFVEEEPNRLEEANELCSQLFQTLQTLKQYAIALS